MTILVWLIIGGLAGWLASKVVNKGEDSGALTNIIVGIIGAMLGGWLVSLMGGSADVLTGFNVASLLTAFFGAVVLLVILKRIYKEAQAKPPSAQNTPGDGWGVLYGMLMRWMFVLAFILMCVLLAVPKARHTAPRRTGTGLPTPQRLVCPNHYVFPPISNPLVMP